MIGTFNNIALAQLSGWKNNFSSRFPLMQRYIGNEKGDGKWERGEPGKVWRNINHKMKLEVMLGEECCEPWALLCSSLGPGLLCSPLEQPWGSLHPLLHSPCAAALG